MAGFLFGAKTGETAESLARKRAIAEALIANATSHTPQNIGEGIAALGQALSGRLGLNALQKQQQAGSAALDEKIRNYGGSGIPSPGAAAVMGATSPAPVDVSDNPVVGLGGNPVYDDFMGTVKTGVSNPYGLAAVAATARAESDFDPKNVNRTWRDPSESGQPGTAGGIMSWRGPRYKALAATGDLSPAGQGRFFLAENPQLIKALNSAKSVEEAQGLMNRAWAFGGYDRPGGETARRMAYAQGFLPKFQGGGQPVASLDPAGMPQTAASNAAAPPSGSIDPQVTTGTRKPSPAVVAALGAGPGIGAPPAQLSPVGAALAGAPAVGAGPLPPLQSRDIAPAPKIAGIPGEGNSRVAQAEIGANSQQTPPPPPGTIDPHYLEILSDPYITPSQAAAVQAMMQQDQARQQAAYDAWLKQNDPSYRLAIEKAQAEVDNLRNPRMSPADEARIRLEQERYADDKGSSWEKLDDGRLFNNRTGEIREAPSVRGIPSTPGIDLFGDGGNPPAAPPAQQPGQVGNGAAAAPKLTPDEAKAAGLADRLTNATALIDQYKDVGRSNLFQGANAIEDHIPFAVPDFLKNQVVPEEYQSYDQARQDFVNALQGRPPGSVVSPQELESATMQYFPLPGDSQDRLDQKKQNREALARAKAREAGASYQPPPPPAAAAATPAPPPAPAPTSAPARRPTARNPNTNEVIEFDGQNWVPVK